MKESRHYIRSYGNFITARNGFDVKGIVTVDSATGKVEQFALADVPEFIDGAVSPEAVSLQNSYFGNYIHGFWNSVIGKKDVKLPSDEGTEANVSPVFDESGHMYYFTDFTSPKEGVDSMLGYALDRWSNRGSDLLYGQSGRIVYGFTRGPSDYRKEIHRKEMVRRNASTVQFLRRSKLVDAGA